MRTYIIAGIAALSLCACAETAQLAKADTYVQAACEVLAERQAQVSKVDSKQLIEKTCAAQGFARDVLRDILRKQQELAADAGVPAPPVTVEQLGEGSAGGGS